MRPGTGIILDLLIRKLGIAFHAMAAASVITELLSAAIRAGNRITILIVNKLPTRIVAFLVIIIHVGIVIDTIVVALKYF